MQRRSFLRGLLIGASTAASTALIKLPTAEEVAALTVNEPVLLGHREPGQMFDAAWGALNGNFPVYIHQDGEYLPIGLLTGIQVSASIHDIATYHGEGRLSPQFTAGLRRGTFDFEGVF